jgi:hypothetical protein
LLTHRATHGSPYATACEHTTAPLALSRQNTGPPTGLPRLLDLAPAEILPVNIDLQKAAIAALAVGRWVKEPEFRARFRKLPESEFQQANVDDLETIALAALHVSVELLTASTEDNAKTLTC